MKYLLGLNSHKFGDSPTNTLVLHMIWLQKNQMKMAQGNHNNLQNINNGNFFFKKNLWGRTVIYCTHCSK